MGDRVALICDHKDCKPPMRNFGDPNWKCPVHKRSVRQVDHPYRQATKKKK